MMRRPVFLLAYVLELGLRCLWRKLFTVCRVIMLTDSAHAGHDQTFPRNILSNSSKIQIRSPMHSIYRHSPFSDSICLQ